MAKIIKIKKDKNKKRVYHVTFKKSPIFGKQKIWMESFKESDEHEYLFKRSGCYLKPDGSELGNGHKIAMAIDNFKKSW